MHPRKCGSWDPGWTKELNSCRACGHFVLPNELVGQCEPGGSQRPFHREGAGLRRGHSPAVRALPARREGRLGQRGGRRAAPQRWAAARNELSVPAGCCRQVASDAARRRRPRLQPRVAFPGQPAVWGRGWVSPSRARTQSSGRRRRGLLLPVLRAPAAASLPAPPARLPPGGLHSERPRAVRPEPTQASQPASQLGGATVTKPATSARSAAAATGFPYSPGPRAPPPPSRPMGAPACRRHRLLSRRAAQSTNRGPAGGGRCVGGEVISENKQRSSVT
nr:translation initiation factor IF-2-like [Pan troglodytes]